MGFFNVLIAECKCANCGRVSKVRIQYKFGSTRQYEFNVGDTIRWGVNEIGNADLRKVKVYGIAESTTCVFCNSNVFSEEYDIFIIDNLIKEVSPISNIEEYLDVNEGNFVILE